MRRMVPILLAACVGCGLPRDPEGTLERVRGGTLRVGVVHDPPWASLREGRPGGVEVRLAGELAEELGAEVTWVPGGESRLFEALERFELDLVVGGIVGDTPWKDRLALTLPFLERGERKHVWAAPPGENGWLVHLDRFLHGRRAELPELLRAEVRP